MTEGDIGGRFIVDASGTVKDVSSAGATARTGPEYESARVPIPVHIGAVFKEGRNIAYVWDPVERKLVHGIQDYSIDNEYGRRAWVLENVGTFSSLEMPSAWKGAADDYLRDLQTAKMNAIRREPSRQKKEEIEKQVIQTRTLLKAMMSVSASARSIEKSAANPELYLGVISQGGEKIDKDAQDFMKTFLLHDDPEKYETVIEDELVKKYYKQILKDADLLEEIDDPELSSGVGDDPEPNNPEWHSFIDNRGRKKWVTSRVSIATQPQILNGRIAEIRSGKDNPEKLLYYLANKAEHGGFEQYIIKLLRRDSDADIESRKNDKLESDAVRFAAARLACDAFISDKMTRWGFQLTSISPQGEIMPEKDIYKDLLDIAPLKDWGGDPLMNVAWPSFLPRVIKGVYKGKAKSVLDAIDLGFKPIDVFFRNEVGYEGLGEEILHPTAVENLKKLARYNDAMGLFYGSSRGAAIGESNMAVLKNSLFDIAEDLAQIYGTLKLSTGELIGPEVLGVMMARLLKAKAMAARAAMVDPPFFIEMFGPTIDPKSANPLRDLRLYLFGSRLDYRTGLVANLASVRSDIVFRGNRFEAEQDLKEAYDILSTPEESGLRKAARLVVAVSTGVTSKGR